jgi:hypothetical protein
MKQNMQGNHLFEYAIIRIVPRPEREEFINVGVILYCHSRNFLQIKYSLDKERIKLFCPAIEIDELGQHLESFERISLGSAKNSPISQLDNASRFRWLTATRSTVVQTSRVHPGFCDDPFVTLNKLFAQMVG